ncbi:hypothetical protein ABT332_08525 [Saccharomonospora azurea]|uniref:hypothetical protein n=1 Tax=Saccharomonospora azurea TaxID=40988 RepID=UPI0033276DA7
MSITARLTVIGDGESYDGGDTVLDTPEAVTGFVEKLAVADPYAYCLRLVHSERSSADHDPVGRAMTVSTP